MTRVRFEESPVAPKFLFFFMKPQIWLPRLPFHTTHTNFWKVPALKPHVLISMYQPFRKSQADDLLKVLFCFACQMFVVNQMFFYFNEEVNATVHDRLCSYSFCRIWVLTTHT